MPDGGDARPEPGDCDGEILGTLSGIAFDSLARAQDW